MNYPIESIPVNIKAALLAVPKKPHKPLEPYKPELFIYEDKPSSTDAKIGLSLFLTCITCFFIGMCWDISIGYVVAALSLLPMLVFIPLAFTYLKKSEKYDDIRIRAEKRYADSMAEYTNVLVPAYPIEMFGWRKKIAEISKKSYKKTFREQLIKSILKRSDIPRVHPRAQKLKKGATEDAVLAHLTRFFPGKVYVNCSAKDSEGEVKLRAPMPDFIIHDSSVGYNVVIEIDEPYDLEFGYPIHYIGRDTSRDEYFLQKDWPVLRFAEKQFFLNPSECCDYIAAFINSVTFNLAGLPEHNTRQKIEPFKCWTEDEAMALELAGFREIYLPAETLGSSLMGFVYKNSGPEIRKTRREQAIIDDAERERTRIARLRAEDEACRKYRYLSDDDNDLPF